MNGINLSITQGGLTQQHRPKEPQTQTSLSPGQFADTPQHAPPMHPPLGVEDIRHTTPDKAQGSGNTWWNFATQALETVSTLLAPAVEAAPIVQFPGGGMSAIGRLGMLIAFFGSVATASAQNLRGNEAANTAFPEWKTHNYFTETKHLEGTSAWFRIAHIADGNSTSARFNLNGHHGQNHWDVNIQLWAGINSISSCWNTANEDHVVQGFRFATGPENHLFLEIQGTPQPDTTILGASATGMGFNPIQFVHATDSIVLRHYDFASIGSLKNGCLSDQISGGAGHVTMVDGSPVITVKETGLGVFQSDPGFELDVNGTARATAFMGDGQALTSLNATELRYGQMPSDRVWGNYTGITAVGELGELVVGGNLGVGTRPTHKLDIFGTTTGIDYVHIQADSGSGADGSGQMLTVHLGGSNSIGSGALIGHWSQNGLGALTARNQIRFFDTGVSIESGANAKLVTVLNTGEVGFGISNPVAPLQVKEHYYDYSIPAISGGSSNQDQIVLFAKVGTAVVFKGTIDTTSTATSNTLLRNFNRIELIYRTSTTNTTQPQVSVVSHHNGHNAHGSDNCKVVKVTHAGEDYWGLILQDLGSYQDPGAPVFTGRASSLSDFQFGYRGAFTAVEDQTITPSLSAMRIPYSSLSAWSFSGDGAGLTNLNANALTTGTIPSLRLLGSYPNITTVGSLTSLRVTGAARFDNTVSIPNLATGTGTALVVDSNGDVFKSSSSTLSLSDGSASTPAITGTTANTGIWFPSAGHMAFSSSGQERARFGGLGNLLIGHTSDINYSSGDQAKLQITGANGGDGSGLFSIFSTTSNTLPGIYLAHANSNTKGTYTLVTNGFKLGILGFAGADGTQFVRAAAIFAEVDGNPGANDMPGRLVFCTTADGSATCTEAMRIDSAGKVGIGNQSPTSRVSVRGTQTITFTTKLATSNMDGVSTISLENLNGVDSMYAAYQFYVHNGAGSDQYASLVAESTTSGYAPKIHFLQRTAASAQSIRMTIDESGKVGVGTTTPDALFTVNGISSFGAGTAALPSMTKVGDLDTGIWFPAADTVAVSTGGSEAWRTDNAGRALFGLTYARTNFNNVATNSPKVQIEGIDNNGASLSIVQSANGQAITPAIYFGKQRSGTIGGNALVQNGDLLGVLSFQGSDGSELVKGALIQALVSGTPGDNSMPTMVTISTTPQGTPDPAEVIRFTADARTGIGCSNTCSSSAKLEVSSTTQGFLPPRMTSVQKNAIVSPTEGLLIYDLTLKKLCIFTGSIWETLTSS